MNKMTLSQTFRFYLVIDPGRHFTQRPQCWFSCEAYQIVLRKEHNNFSLNKIKLLRKLKLQIRNNIGIS